MSESKTEEVKKHQFVNITELHKIAPGLNIEGGLPQISLVKDGIFKDKIWANVVLVLDCPLVGEHNITFDELLATNPYPLLENAIEEINEHKFLAMYLMILGYYFEHGHELMKLDKDKILNITVHVHQDITCKSLISIIMNQLNHMIDHFNIDMDKINIEFRTDTPTYVTTERNYNDTHILVSLSQCAGLDSKYPAGEMFVPTEFIPYDIKKKEISVKNKYKVQNDLLAHLDDMLKSKYHKYAVEYVNKNYHSYNPKKDKTHSAPILTMEDFHHKPFLIFDQLWNPIDRKESVLIVN